METTDLIKEDRFLIFLGKSENKSHQYLLLPKDFVNDGNEATGKVVWYSVKWNGNAGSIYKVSATENGEQVSYDKKNFSVGKWKNKEQLLEWQANQRACEDKEYWAKQNRKDELLDYLESLRDAYKSTSNRQQRAVMLARIIDYITY